MKLPKLLAIFLVSALLLTACAPASTNGADLSGMKMASTSGMPVEVLQSAQTVRAAYQFAVANPEVLKNVPCYCGCGAAGHTSNYSCYIKNDEGGKITYDLHATGCSICVDITQDAMRMLKVGKSIPEIKANIDQTYSRFGPSNMN